MALIGYARVSREDQNLDLQVDALKRAGCIRIFTDHGLSGTLTRRPELDAALDYVRDGDTLVVWKLDRLGRSLKHLIETVNDLDARHVGFRSLQEAMDTTTPGGKLIFHIFGSLAEFERELIRERTMAGLASARARGRVGGRKPKLTDDQVKLARQLYDARDHTVDQIAAMFGVTKPTIYRHLDRTAAPAGQPI
jgi:DNA invertase Pin-like site-specific DNA recombinase